MTRTWRSEQRHRRGLVDEVLFLNSRLVFGPATTLCVWPTVRFDLSSGLDVRAVRTKTINPAPVAMHSLCDTSCS